MTTTIQSLTHEFQNKMIALIDEAAAEKARNVVAGAFLADMKTYLPKNKSKYLGEASHTKDKLMRRKGPIQLCPVPRCKERAAPVFGMLCAKHKSTPKKLVAKYRAARRARK
jgi:hypothetical protein